MEIDNTFLTSDNHYLHPNLVRGTSKWKDKSQCRDFDTVEEHDELQIKNHNNKVPKNATVINLGDFCFGRDRFVAERYLRRLNFREMYYIFGNHDSAMEDFFHHYGNRANFEGRTIINCGGYFEYKFGLPYKQSQFFVFCHYHILEWNKKHHNAIMCAGHSHGHLNRWISQHMPDDKIIDLAPECHNYTPLSIREIMEKMVNKKNGTHHKRD
jgi:calcineurin-like phosphoesterase family protein